MQVVIRTDTVDIFQVAQTRRKPSFIWWLSRQRTPVLHQIIDSFGMDPAHRMTYIHNNHLLASFIADRIPYHRLSEVPFFVTWRRRYVEV